MQQVILFQNEEFGQMRAVNINGNLWVCLTDVCKALDLTQASKVKERLNAKGVNTIPTLTAGGMQNLLYINEPNLYRAIFQSRKEAAERFTDWVTSEVLPSIRKTGGYINSTSIEQIIQHTVTETIQAVVPEVMKAVMNNMIPFLLGQQKAVTVVKTAEKRNESLENEKDYYTYETDVAFHLMGINKIELFPEEMLEQVNGIMEGMRREQKLNCNLIARFCKNLGYPVSKETVKEYFEKKFLKG